MKFIRKLMYYLLGVGLGVLMVIFFFGDRDIQCSYFPNDRVLYDLRKKELKIPADIEHSLSERGIDTSMITMLLLNGEVDFEKSQTQDQDSCNTYWIDYDVADDPKFSVELMNCDSTAYMLGVY